MDFYFPSLYKNMSGCFKGTEGLFYSSAGKIYYVYAGKGECVLLLHNLGPGMSSYEWCRNFNELSKHFKVFAVDMPGYARSEKNTYIYTAPVFIRFIKDFIVKKIKSPVYIVASGISANYAVLAAYGMPKYVRGVIMSSPVTSSKDYQYFPEAAEKDCFKSIYRSYMCQSKLKSFASNCICEYAAENGDGMLDEMYRCMLHQPFGEYAAGSYIGGFSDVSCEYVLNMLECPVNVLPGKRTPEKKFGNYSGVLKKTLSPHIEDSIRFNETVINLASGF